jgi:hypothetical protein
VAQCTIDAVDAEGLEAALGDAMLEADAVLEGVPLVWPIGVDPPHAASATTTSATPARPRTAKE